MTESFGTRLRKERERRQIPLADIASRTKIKASLFEAIERDDASHWPSGIFRRSFMRAYADALGLEASAVGVKGKTNEGMGETGRGEGIAVHAVALVSRR